MKFAWNEIDLHMKETYDLFICSASFEERCLSFVRSCPVNRLNNALILQNKEYNSYVAKNLAIMKEILSTKQIHYDEAVLSHKDPISFVDTIMNKLNEAKAEKRFDRVLVDITTFTHEMVLIMLRMLHVLHPNLNVSFTYANAGDYDPQSIENITNISSKWLSKGISEIRSVIGYPGNPQPMNRNHLVIVVGYEYDRALSIISELEPSSLSLAFGKSDSQTSEHKSFDKHYGAKEHFKELTSSALASFPEGMLHTFEISCDNPQKTKEEIKSHLHSIGVEKERTNVTIFALNNKPSTLGVGLFGIENEYVQLCYAPALIYNYANYSTPGSYCYLFDLNTDE